MAAVRGVSLEGSEETRPTIVDAGFLGALVQAERRLPEFLRTPEGHLERREAQIARALKRAVEPELGVAESPNELALELLGGGSAPFCLSRAPDGRDLVAATLRSRRAARGTAPRGAMAIAATLLPIGPLRKTTHGCWWHRARIYAESWRVRCGTVASCGGGLRGDAPTFHSYTEGCRPALALTTKRTNEPSQAKRPAFGNEPPARSNRTPR